MIDFEKVKAIWLVGSLFENGVVSKDEFLLFAEDVLKG
jgi:hypothetical protein